MGRMVAGDGRTVADGYPTGEIGMRYAALIPFPDRDVVARQIVGSRLYGVDV